jgi:hypothetical protein
MVNHFDLLGREYDGWLAVSTLEGSRATAASFSSNVSAIRDRMQALHLER